MQEVILHGVSGGFHINDEMALWLVENKNWTISKNEKNNPDILEFANDYNCSGKYEFDDIRLRTNPDLIECVKALQVLHKNEPYHKRNYIFNLKIVKVEIQLRIENYYDGKERLIVDNREL